MQTGIHEKLPPPPPNPATALDPCDYIRLDLTRVTHVKAEGDIAVDPKGQVLKTGAYSTIHASERTPEDPWFSVVYMQDDLPFDANGNLVKDDNRTAPFQGMGPDGKPITYHPLWTDAMRKTRDRKMRKIIEMQKSKSTVADDEPEDAEIEEIRSDAVNINDWLMGDMDYRWELVQRAIKRRFSVSLPSVSEGVRFLVYEAKIMARENIADKYKRYLSA